MIGNKARISALTSSIEQCDEVLLCAIEKEKEKHRDCKGRSKATFIYR